jgi:oligosaccharyltransferase complex subunit alpha (ribophorin I)
MPQQFTPLSNKKQKSSISPNVPTDSRLPGEIKSYTKSKANADGESDPTVSGFILTYGPYDKHIPSTPPEQISVHYEYTAPITYVDHVERDIEISHWGNKVAIEERYILTNHAARYPLPFPDSQCRLKDQFSRLQYTRNSYSSPPTHAITRLAVALKNGAKDAYYTDIIGNVSTSRFRAARGTADAHLEVQPRFPIYGGWNYTFRLGWNIDLERVQKIANEERILKVPFLEGPENIQYENFDITIVLPEGSRYTLSWKID